MRFHVLFSSIVAASAFWTGCGGQTQSSSSDVEAIESELTGADDSQDSAREQVKACFDTFKACESSGEDKAVCREQLRSCLPEGAPHPRRCGHHPGRGEDGRMPPPPPPGGACDGGDRPPPPPPPPPPGSGEGGDRPPPRKCGPPPIPREKLEACRTALEEAVAAGEDRETARAAHEACMRAAFEAHRAEVCRRGQEACAAGEAPADVCSRIREACK
jgi:hypothetical protein